MDFIDNSGHIFSIPSYTEEPVGYEFEESKYIFWFDAPYTNTLSINNYYAKTINFLVYYDDVDGLSFDDLINVEISMNSDRFWLLNPQQIQEAVNGNASLNDFIHMDEIDDMYVSLSNDDLIAITVSDDINSKRQVLPRTKVAIIPIYVVSMADSEGSWITNILIHVWNKNNDNDAVNEEYCAVSVGAIYSEENEILSINGTNMGVQLPKEIYKAVYQCSYFNDVFDEQLANEKLREYLMNYMGIKGELGNYQSIRRSLEWFGYGDKITLSKLLKTDNEFKAQYVKDFFNIETDILDSFKSFTNNALLSLFIKENEETDMLYDQDFSALFWGENKPYMNDIFNSLIPVEVGISNDKWTYYKPYYDYSFYEIGLKLSCLKYYYQKYFLPIHLKIHSASVAHKVFANDIKFNNYVYSAVRTESPYYMTDTDEVEFPKFDIRYFTNQVHYITDQYNEFEGIDGDVYKIDDVCLNIPIKFKSYNKYYNCVLLLEKEKTLQEDPNLFQLRILEKPFNPMYYDLLLYDKSDKSLLDNSSYLYRFKADHMKEWSTYIIGYDNLKDYMTTYFRIRLYSKNSDEDIDEYNINIEYDDKFANNIKLSIDLENIFNNYSYLDAKTIKELLNITDNTISIQKTPIEINNKDYYIYIPSIKEFLFNPMNVSDVIGFMTIVPKVNIEMKFDKYEINDCILKCNFNPLITMSIKKNIRINYIEINTLLYESHFNFIQREDDESSIYKCFVLYPKILNDKNVNYFIDQRYTLRLLVNDRWYEYQFTSKLQDVYIDFGTIKYSYWNTPDNYYSYFSQLADIKPNTYENNVLSEKGYVKFNSYLFEPDFVNVNNIKYISDVEEYLINNNLDYINNDILKHLIFSKYVQINKCKIWFVDEYFKEEQTSYINLVDLDRYDEIYVVSFNLIFGKIDSSIYKKFKNANYAINKANKNFGAIVDELSLYTYKEYIKITNNTYNVFITYVNENNEEHELDIKTRNDEIYNVSSNQSIYQTYDYLVNVTNNEKFLNQIYVYDLYHNETDYKDVLSFYSSFEISCNGLTFKHSTYDNYNEGKENINKIYINGTTLWSNQYYDDKEYMDKENEWNSNDRDEFGYTLSKIVDKYGFYWSNSMHDRNGNRDLETAYIEEEATKRYFYYYSLKLDAPINSDKLVITKTIKVCDFTVDNYVELERKDKVYDDVHKTDSLPPIYGNLIIAYVDDEFIIKYMNLETNTENIIFEVMAKIEYVDINDNVYDAIDTSEYIKLMAGDESEYRLKISLYINHKDTYIGEPIYVEPSQVHKENGENYVYIGDQKVNVFEKFVESDQRNDRLIPDRNPKNYIWSGRHIFNIDSESYVEADYSAIENYFKDTGDLELYWHDFDNLKNSNDFKHERSYLRKNILQYLIKDEEEFVLSWDSSDKDNEVDYELSCEVLITHNDGTNEIIQDNNTQFTLKKTDKEALLYIVVKTNGNPGEIIENAWITPKVYNIVNLYRKVPYNNTNISSNQQINMDNIDLLFDFNNSENVINMYNDLFKVGIYDKDNKTVLSEYAYEVEKLYNIEKRYDVWKLTNEFIVTDYATDSPYIMLTCEDITKYYEIDNLISFHNFVNLAKFDFSYRNKVDFYEIKVYDINEEEIKEGEYIEDERYVKLIDQTIKLKESSLDYDLYLMHDLKYWYIVFISQDTISRDIDRTDKPVKELLPDTVTDKYENNTHYLLKYSGSKQTFLINRMKYISSEGVHHFNKNDMIAARVANMKLPVNIYSSTKWEITPLSIGMDFSQKIDSNAELAILSLPMNNNEYQKGYYDVNLRYCIDNNVQHQIIKLGKIRVS